MSAYLTDEKNGEQIKIIAQETYIGRLSTNTIQLNHQSISKNHAIINYFKQQDKYYLIDLDSVNGTYLNGNKVRSKQLLRHNDKLCIGKYPCIFTFNISNNPPSQNKIKINLKDYCFELSDSTFQKDNSTNIQHKVKVKDVIKQQTQLQMKYELKRSAQFNKPNDGRIKIDNIADYLELEESFENSLTLEKDKQKQIKEQQMKSIKNPRINLPSVDKWSANEEKQLYEQFNLYKLHQQAKIKQANQTRKIEQDKIMKQVQRIKQQEQILLKRIQIQKQLHKEQQRLKEQEKIMKQEIKRRQKQEQSQEQCRKQQQIQKQTKMLQRMKNQKQEAVQEILRKQEELRNNNEKKMKHEIEQKKIQLQLQAKALAKQYEQIYIDTINKIKRSIIEYQNNINKSQQSIQKMQKQIENMQHHIQNYSTNTQHKKKILLNLNGRNKAYLLYASHLQDKIQKIKFTIKDKKKISNKNDFKQTIQQSRKLLKLKLHQNLALQENISSIWLELKMKNPNKSAYFETIKTNHKNIIKLKQQYFQYIEQQKQLQNIWQISLHQNEKKQTKNRTLMNEILHNRKILDTDIKNNINKIQQQRKYMFKSIENIISEEKRKASKFIIEQMNSIGQQIRQLSSNTQQIHDKIVQTIIKSQRLQSNNKNLSQLLFRGGSSNHHFDNMKALINQIIAQIQLQKSQNKIQDIVQLQNQVQQLQYTLQNELQKSKQIKMKKKQEVHNLPLMNNYKNPIIFFGDLLLQKDTQLDFFEKSINSYQRQIKQIQIQNDSLKNKRDQLDLQVTEYKKMQIIKAKQYLSS